MSTDSAGLARIILRALMENDPGCIVDNYDNAKILVEGEFDMGKVAEYVIMRWNPLERKKSPWWRKFP